MPPITEIWTPERQDLWARIERHDFEPPQTLTFMQRLARDHAWTLEEARAAIGAYRRFCFLAAISTTPMTPSEIVDEVWHQHLIYTRDYWDVWCGQVLRTKLHHDPTPGGPDARQIYRRQYAETLAMHERFFGPPPVEFWPATHERFGAKPQYWMLDRRRFVAASRPGVIFRRLFTGKISPPVSGKESPP